MPEIGDIVHYAQFNRCEASIVTAVNAGDQVDLITFPGNGAMVTHVGVDYDAANEYSDTWHNRSDHEELPEEPQDDINGDEIDDAE